MKKAEAQGAGADSREESKQAPVSMKTRIRWILVGGVLGVGISTWAGESLHQPVRSAAQQAHSLALSLWDRYAEARSSVRSSSLEQQVRARFEGDRSVDAESIEVSVQTEGVVTLKGLVPDKASKQKAMELARDTRGVKKVIDHLAVTPTPRIVAVPAEGDEAEAPAIAERPISRQ